MWGWQEHGFNYGRAVVALHGKAVWKTKLPLGIGGISSLPFEAGSERPPAAQTLLWLSSFSSYLAVPELPVRARLVARCRARE
jgi:hypothetical protein